MLDITIE